MLRPSLRVAAAAVVAVAVGAVGAWAAGFADALPTFAFGSGLAALVFVAAVAHRLRQDMRLVADYAARLAGADAPPPPGLTAEGRRLAGAVGRLQRSLRREAELAGERHGVNDSLIDSLHDPLVLIDRSRQVTRANRAARSLFGDRMPGRDLAASLRHPGVLEAVDAVLGGAVSRSVEYTMPVPVERVFEARIKPLRQQAPPIGEGTAEGTAAQVAPPDTGGPGRVILTLHDITAVRRSEQMRADFIANASHELRTPLSTLLGFIETLRGPAHDDPEARDRFLSIMHEQASRMSRLVADLLSLSRIELDEHMPPAGQVDVVRSLKAVLAALELKAAARKIRLILQHPPVAPEVVGDEDQLSQVFQNLVSNAIKYTREQTEVTVSVSVSDGLAVGGSPAGPSVRRVPRLGAQMVAIAVSDRGEGIARTHLPRLTERFYRVDAARSRAMGGTGLGLAIVKHIISRHRGRLTIESEVGTGSTFTVYLPVALADRPEVPLRSAGGDAA